MAHTFSETVTSQYPLRIIMCKSQSMKTLYVTIIARHGKCQTVLLKCQQVNVKLSLMHAIKAYGGTGI
jgi:hypothetical protein